MESQKHDSGRYIRYLGIVLAALLTVFLLIYLFVGTDSSKKNMVYSDYLDYFRENKVESFSLDLGSGKLKMVLREAYREDIDKDGKIEENEYTITYSVPNISLFVQDVTGIMEKTDYGDKPIRYDYFPQTEIPWFITLLPSALVIVLVVVLFIFLRRSMSNMDGGKMLGFGKAHVKQVPDERHKTTFADVAGADEEKEDLREIVEFLKAPKKYRELGARIPKGVLLVGPPGTGKTLLARAVAGEADVPFFSISGSDFVEMYVGVGASRVRDLFDQAKKNSPCIIFIDEIDAVGRQRGAGLGGGHDEREQTLNQMLVEMDGFGVNEGVIIMAATNRPDILDPALMRPGRFDRRVVVNYPDQKGREEILKVHARGKPLAPDADLSVIAKSTAGFTGADLENLLNEAALLAARKNLRAITMTEIEEATVKIIIGTEKRSHIITKEEMRQTAYHEAGHAVVSYYSKTADPVHQISVIPRGMAGGYTLSLPQQDKMYRSRTEMLEEIEMLLGGGVAEKLIFNDVFTGASNDIERATQLARSMITQLGMSNLGPLAYGKKDEMVFLGREISEQRNYSEAVAESIDEEV
ncbi:MAG: ATP-dependent zinc metalloprotease FtsH, partial [Clostridia bacterium]|nr:ATP-dependent zinc metalloprotease FtsH [Clostridia bacterium]